MDKYTGKRLDGRYEIQELIGVGGMAMVYKAYDNIDDKTVAIKILKDEFLGNEDFIRRFKNESKAIAVLSHPNIVKVYDVSFGDRIQYIVMEYIDGITLKEYIGQQNVISWKEAVHFTVQILQALQHAHEKGVVHRDVKPQNIMLLQDGTIKVTDFGIALVTTNDTRTMTKNAIGSVHYIAPEQAKGSVTDGKADIYSVGVMLYEMLTGKLPFDADSAVSVAIMQLQNDPKPPREINSRIPEGLEEITLRAMRKEPRQRYESAREMLEAIEIFRKDPTTRFNYNYFEDGAPTKYIESLGAAAQKPAAPAAVYNSDFGGYDDDVPTSKSKSVVKWITVLVSMLVVAALIFFFVLIVQNLAKQTEAETVDVPNLIGKNIEEVTGNKAYKFNFRIIDTNEGDTPNVVTAQDPEAGTKKIKENATIKLTVYTNKKKVEVPKVKNYQEQKAIEKLEAKGFTKHDEQRVYSTDVAAGYVIDSTPQEGTQQYVDTTITLIISAGPAPEQIEIPSVTGLSFDMAKANLEALGFNTEKAMVASALDAGTVIGTDPLPGNKITKRKITIQVSDGSKIRKALDYDVDLPADEYASISVKIIQNEADGKNTTLKEFDSIIPGEGNKVTVHLEPDGAVNDQKQITVMIDGKRYETLVFDFKNQTVARTYLDTNYEVKQPGDMDYKIKKYNELLFYAAGYTFPSISDLDVRKRAITAVNQTVALYGSYDDKEKTYSGAIFDATSKSLVDALLEQAIKDIDEVAMSYVELSSLPSEESSGEPSENSDESSEEPAESSEESEEESFFEESDEEPEDSE